MSPEVTGFALGLLLGAAKVMAIAAVGFGIAWWRSRLRVRALQEELAETQAALEESLAHSLPPAADTKGASLPPPDRNPR